MSVSQNTGSNVVAVDGLKEQQTMDTELHVVWGWLEDPETVADSHELRIHSPEVQHL